MSDTVPLGPLLEALRRIRTGSGVSLAFGGLVEAGRQVRLRHFVGRTAGALDGVAVNIGHGLGGKVAALHRPMVVDDYLRTPAITHRYNPVIAAEGLRAMAAAPVIVDRKPVAVLYGALHSADPLGDRTLQVLAEEARAVEQAVVTARAVLERGQDPEVSALRDRLGAVYAELRVLAREVGDAALADRIARIGEETLLGSPPASPAPELTAREADVLALAALGYGNARIADALGLTVETVKGYVKNALRKLGASTRLEAVVRARRAGLLP
ncbi:LuxR C-terminal-related transcriptional regulator [Nocardia thailandica]